MDERPIDRPWVANDVGSIEEVDEPQVRRRWPVVVVSLVVVIAAIAVAFYLAVSHYQPLSQTQGGGYGSQVLASNGTVASEQLAGGTNGTVIWGEPSGNYTVEIIVTLNNDQRFGVTIDKVLPPTGASGDSKFQVFFDSKAKASGSYGYKGGPAFTPTALGSGGELQLVVHWSQTCVAATAALGAMNFTDLPVSYTFEGFQHTVTVPIETFRIRDRPTC